MLGGIGLILLGFMLLPFFSLLLYRGWGMGLPSVQQPWLLSTHRSTC